MLTAQRVAMLAQGWASAKAEIAPHYDEVFYEVAKRIKADGSVGKGDVAMLTVWKRLRADTPWVRQLLAISDARVRELSAPAVVAARNGDVATAAGHARELLRELPGFRKGTALASAVLAAAAPTRLAVYDTRAHEGLRIVDLDLADNAPHFYSEYMTFIEQCRAEAAQAGYVWSAREIDLALFMLGKPSSPGTRSVVTSLSG